MASNEHLDMSGNWSELPFYCDRCGKDFPEEDMHGVDRDDSLMFCSAFCAQCHEEDEEVNDGDTV